MKKTLNTLTYEELKKVWNTNEKIRNEYYEYIYSRNNDLLEEELKNLLGESKTLMKYVITIIVFILK